MDKGRDEIGRGASRRDFLKSVAGVAVSYPAQQVAAMAGTLGLANSPTGPRPNILLLHSHDLGRFLNCYGQTTAHTPNLNGLAAEGVLFERSFATAPQCSPSRASIFTGRYPHSNGVLGLTHFPFNWELNPDEAHLGQILKQAGYRTGGVGIIHETHLGPKRCGLDEYKPNAFATPVADETIAMLTEFAKDPATPFYIQAGTVETHRMETADHNADIGFLGRTLTPDTSAGVSVPGYLRDTPGTQTEIAELQGSVRHLDEELGRIFAALKELNLDQNTLVIFTTDHGVALPRAKCSVYEPGQETAFILRLPSRPGWSGGRRESALISNIDYLPTILDVAGIPVPSNVQGRSFAPLLDGGTYTPRDVIFYEMTYHSYYDPVRAIRTEDHKLIVYFSVAPAFMDPSESWRPRSDTIVPANDALAFHHPMELYDLKNDPFEQTNVIGKPEYASIQEDLRKRLYAQMTQTNDPLLAGAVPDPTHRKSLSLLQA